MRRLLSLLALALLLLPAAAHASGATRIGIADDRELLHAASDEDAAALVERWKALGVDDVRIFAKTDDFGQPYDFGPLDRAVGAVSAAGLRPILSLTGPRYKPNPELYAQFAATVAQRYASEVDTYILWNEPNLPQWLQPQSTCAGRRCTPYAPYLYRQLVRAAYPAVKAADPTSTVLAGALAPRGDTPTSANARLKPLFFLRSLACVDKRYRRDRSGPCRGFQPLTADGIAYHPHATTFSPTTPRADLDEAAIADLPRLERVLDAAQRAGGLRSSTGGHFGLWLSEWGYQTRPPDPIQGVTLSQQSRWLQVGGYLAWRDPRVRLLTQYAWRDEPLGPGNVLVKYSGWQSGLLFADGRPKPSLATFPNPFDVTVHGRTATIWGQVRPGGAHQVTIQRRRPGTTRWIAVATPTTNEAGYFVLRKAFSGAQQLRFTWLPDGAPAKASDALTIHPR